MALLITVQLLLCNFFLQELRKQRLIQLYTVDDIKVVKIRMSKPTVAQNIANSTVHHSPNIFDESSAGMSASKNGICAHYS